MKEVLLYPCAQNATMGKLVFHWRFMKLKSAEEIDEFKDHLIRN